jgi:hypothetical protein
MPLIAAGCPYNIRRGPGRLGGADVGELASRTLPLFVFAAILVPVSLYTFTRAVDRACRGTGRCGSSDDEARRADPSARGALWCACRRIPEQATAPAVRGGLREPQFVRSAGTIRAQRRWIVERYLTRSAPRNSVRDS